MMIKKQATLLDILFRLFIKMSLHTHAVVPNVLTTICAFKHFKQV